MDASTGRHSSLQENNSASSFAELILMYLFGQDTITFPLRFGISSVKTARCGNCDFTLVTEHHNVVLNEETIKMMQKTANVKCCSCGDIGANCIQVVTNVGSTVMLSDNNGDIQQVLECLQVYRQIDYSYKTSKQIYQCQLSIADVEHTFQQDLLIPTTFQKNSFELNNSSFSITLTESTKEIIINFDASITANKIVLNKYDVFRYVNSYLSDKNIDVFFQTVSSYSYNTCIFMPAGWFASKLGATELNRIEANLHFFDADLVLVPVNTNCHWILVAIEPKLKNILYLDPLGNPVKQAIVNRLMDFLLFHHVVETMTIMKDEWKLLDLMESDLFERQVDGSSCGAMVCLYGKMLAQRSPILEKHVSASSVRLFILYEIVKEFCNEDGNNISLRTILFTKDIADIVRDIMTGRKNFDFNNRHSSFLKNPKKAYSENKLGFARNYIKEDEYYAICDHLERRFFKKTRTDKSIYATRTSITIFEEAVSLNLLLAEEAVYSLGMLSVS
ncbi:hypothetical protein KUTeg_018930 [Tegillarca granosa]|uniref:Ubiquitin-like protease family profile domain-containing protein n=1 Tax=Tegillarca granosa TaxID=220873 RepID=A0ABQ9ED76_TEGGR|nr:hypothetical protein KUTeg_018930 [Tegillarca granosa]